MADERKPLVELEETLQMAAQKRVEKARYQRELRGLEINAYSGLLQAFRASGKPNMEKEGIIKTLREYFNISEDRHKAEIRLLAFDNRLQLISKKLTGFEFTEEWAFQAQRTYVPLGPQPFSIFKMAPKSSSGIVVRDPIPSRTFSQDNDLEEDEDDEELLQFSSDSDSCSESELKLIDNLIDSCNGITSKSKAPSCSISIAVEPGAGNEDMLNELGLEVKKSPVKKQESIASAKSPDITDAHRTAPIKSKENFGGGRKKEGTKSYLSTKKSRGLKRKKLEDFNSSPLNIATLENSTTKIAAKKLAEKSKNIIKTKKTNRIKRKIRMHPTHSGSDKVRESSEETSSADEGENGPMTHDASSRVLSPVFSEVIRTNVLSRTRVVAKGGNIKGEKRKNNLLSTTLTKSGKYRSNQKSGKLKASTSSGSRRKSKLNEKIDYDEVLINVGKNRASRKPRPTHTPGDISRRIIFENKINDHRAMEDCAVYTNSLPLSFINEGMEQVTDGVFKRPLPPSKGPKPWEIQDARLNHSLQQVGPNGEHLTDENIDDGDRHIPESEILQHSQRSAPSTQYQIHILNDSVASTFSTELNDPPTKKQRIKSPIIIKANTNSPTNPKLPLPPPVFSTTINTVNKKRGANNNLNNNNNKPISVVDSLNLHLPTSATASSLAASSSNRRPGTVTGGGCSMFSNSSALIAGARGTAPGILQQQRKAQPHILSNSKVHQRTFLPQLNSPSNSSSTINAISVAGTPITISASCSTISSSPVPVVAPGGQPIQITATPIPISGMSSPGPTSPLPFHQSFSNTSPPSMNHGPGIPIGHISKSPTGTNIIFVQKANGPTIAGTSGTEVPSNMIPIKTQPRAVILRRAQLPRQGNVMILDMQKNQIVGPGQAPPFLQTARVVNSQGEYSLVNIQPSSGMKSPQSLSIELSTATAQALSSAPIFQQAPQQLHPIHGQNNETIVFAPNPESYITVSTENHSQSTTQVPSTECNIPIKIIPSDPQQEGHILGNMQTTEGNVSNSGLVQEVRQDAQYAQIEAELMQMETDPGSFEEVVYEEEVMTEIVPMEDHETTQYIYSNEEVSHSGEVISASQGDVQLSIRDNTNMSETDVVAIRESGGAGFKSSDSSEAEKLSSATKVLLSPTAETKLASEAISRALTLSKSTAKRLALTPPISLSTAATLANNLTISNKSNIDSDTIAETISNQISIVPSSLFQETTSELNLTPIVIDAEHNTPSTNPIQSEKLQGLEFTIRSNEGIQTQQKIQGRENST